MANNQDKITKQEAISYVRNFWTQFSRPGQQRHEIEVNGKKIQVSPTEYAIGPDLYDYIVAISNSSAPVSAVQMWATHQYTSLLLRSRDSLFSLNDRKIFFSKDQNEKNKLNFDQKSNQYIYYDGDGEYLNTKYVIHPQEFFQIISPHGLDFTKVEHLSVYDKLYKKALQSDLLNIVFFKPQIQKFAQKRFTSKAALQKSAIEGLTQDPGKDFDIEWLNLLIKGYNTLLKDPVLAYQIHQYMPKLAQFIFDSLAATADYSNNGLGGSTDDPLNDPVQIAVRMFKSFGIDENGEAVFSPAWSLVNTAVRIQKALEEFPFRANIPPKTPDIFHLRIGASNFYVPPVSINVDVNFRSGSLTGGAIRQKNSPKFNTGYKDTVISTRLYFPNYEEIWGLSVLDGSSIDLRQDNFDIKINSDSEEKIDKFLSSLRGLVAMFKSSPIIPIKNDYLNRVHGITGVTLSNMSISTIPNFPFCLVVDLEMNAFNHKPFLPMIKDFNQAVHWGKYRHYMTRAGQDLDKYVNAEFLIKKASETEQVVDIEKTESNIVEETISIQPYSDWKDGNNIEIYMPERLQSKIFTPDTSTFATDQEKLLSDTGRDIWSSILYRLGIDINESASYGRSLDQVVTSREIIISPNVRRKVNTALDILLAGKDSKEINDKVYDYLARVYLQKNPNIFIIPDGLDYILRKTSQRPSDQYNTFKIPRMPIGSDGKPVSGVTLVEVRNYLEFQSRNSNGLLEELIERIVAEKLADPTLKITEIEAREQAKQELIDSFNKTLYERFFIAGPIKDYIDAAQRKEGSYSFNEWEVPMIKVNLNPKNVIVDGVSLTMGNNLVKLQVQLQDEPTYQHIGGKDTYINMSLTVFGEEELIKLRNIFDHISGLARLENAAGVIGFLGLKNIITTLAGVKYVLPLRYNVDTIPNFPHVYKVQLTLVDFDIFQQKRERLSHKQQEKFAEEFGTKKNPFLRIKQLWGAFNSYPDMPLELRNKEGDVVGCLDPDYYFRGFDMFDRDVINNQSIQETAILKPSMFEGTSEESKENEEKKDQVLIDKIVDYLRNDEIENLQVFANANQITPSKMYSLIQKTIIKYTGFSESLLLDYVDSLTIEDKLFIFSDTNFAVPMGEFKVGEITSGAKDKLEATLSEILDQTKNIEDKLISIDPDNLMAGVDNSNGQLLEYMHGIVYAVPAMEEGYSVLIPAMMQTAARI